VGSGRRDGVVLRAEGAAYVVCGWERIALDEVMVTCRATTPASWPVRIHLFGSSCTSTVIPSAVIPTSSEHIWKPR
jgi:hypothetical protein